MPKAIIFRAHGEYDIKNRGGLVAKQSIKSDVGALDVGALIFGILISALLAALVGLGLFKLVPWVQDTYAQKSLNSVVEAQTIAYTQTGKFHDKEKLVGYGLLGKSHQDKFEAIALASEWQGVEQEGLPSGEHYVAQMRSASGKLYVAHDGEQFAKETLPPVDDSAGAMVSIWDTTLPGCTTITLPILWNINGSVSWGDGVVDTINTNTPSHTYEDQGTVTVTYRGTFENFEMGNAAAQPSAHCLRKITQWKNTGTKSLYQAFKGADNLTAVPQIPSTVTSIQEAFVDVSGFNGDISRWDTANVQNMSQAFYGAKSFNRSIDAWNTGSVTNASNMFNGASSFNQPLGSWNTSNITDFSHMFSRAGKFNQPLHTWDMSNATTLSNMFYKALSFDRELSSWNLTMATDLSGMFKGATSFRQSLNWTAPAITDISHIFSEATAFDRDLPWDVSKVENFSYAFYEASSFDRDLSSWNTAKAVNMEKMFQGASSFNRQIVGWEIPNVTNMDHMFYNAKKFSQDLSGWDISNVSAKTGMFNGSAMENQTSLHPSR